jgi:hypothetical protein
MIIFKLIAKNFLVVCIAFSTAQASQLVGRVIGITDGDTITVLDSEKKEHTHATAFYLELEESRKN